MKKTKEIICPNCRSNEVSKPRLSGLAFVVSFLLLGFPLPFFSKTVHCFDCGIDFKKNSKKNPTSQNA